MARHYLDGASLTVCRTEKTLCTLTEADGTTYEKAEPRYLFPLSRHDYITFLDPDGHEIGILSSVEALSESSREAVCTALDEYYRIPKILAVTAISDKSGSLNWSVRTDRGDVTFQIRTRNSDILPLPDGRVLFRDTNDNRYEIPDIKKLDAQSKRLLNTQI